MKKQQDNNTQNKKFRILLGILILWLMCGQTLWAQTTNKYCSIDIYADSYAGGDGSKTNPYEIATAEQLAKLARDVNNGNTFRGKYFKLTADIDLSGGIWMPIGKYYNYGNGKNRLFFGKFDGNGHVIKNMHIQWENADDNAKSVWGLFSTLQGESSTNLTTVTNLIIEKARVEKKSGFTPDGPSYNVGVVAGEIYGNTELSNIIIRGSEITDNDETYEINRETKIGGIAGNVQTDSNNETFRIFNIAADTKINMLKKASVFYNQFYIAQGFGRFNYDMNGGGNSIQPTNIYLFGDGLNIENTSTNINKGGITANCKNEGNANKYASTWYYTQNVTGGKNLGTQKTDASFMKEFVDKANEFINKNPLVEDKNTWNFSDGKFTLNKKMEIYVVEKYNRNETQVAYTLDVKNATTTYNYTWKVDNEQITPVEGSNGTTIRLPLSNKKRKGSVTLKDSKTQQVIQTKYFDINPKYYSIDLYADNYTRGTGTKEDPFIISSDLELAKLARDVQNKQLQENKYFKLAKDISLDKGLWMPIGTTNNNGAVFKGKFDGDGHTIDNMHISWADNSSPWNDWALFATVQGTAANEAGFCRITNLIIDNALIEKEPSPNQNEKSGNVAVLVGEVLTKGYVEISNIIVRNSIITDYNDTYTRKQFRVGGIIGNLDDNHETRLFNLSSDVEIKMLSNARLNDECYMAEGIGRYGNPNTGNSYVIPLTNIYVHNKLETSNTSNKLKIGGVIGNKDMGAGNSATENWYYASPVSGTQNNVMNNGTQKSLADFAMTFVNQNNTYISDKNIEDKNTWTYTEGTGFAFGSTTLTVERGVNAVITAETIKGNGANEKYFWYTSSDKKTWKLQNEKAASNPFTLPREKYDQYVYAVLEDGSSRSGIIKIEAIRVEATMNHDASSNLLTILVTNNIWENNDNLNITYKWVKNDDEQNPVGNGPTYDKSTIGINDKLSCLVTVTTRDENPKVLFNEWLYFAKSVVYLCPARATGTAANGNTTEYNQGNDSNDGHTPETAVKTWKGAYSKLAKEGTWADNIIVLMGMSDKDVTNNGNDGFTSVTFNTSSEWENKKSTSPFFKNTTITGSWNDVDYGGVIQMRGGNERSDGLPIYGDTRFQHLTFKRNDYGGEKYDILYCQFYNLEMGEGIQMINYTEPFNGDGTIDGAKSTSFQIFGGFMNDNRFAPLSTEGNLKKMDDALPHGHEGFKIKIKSGHYSTICVGGRQTVDQRNGVMGSPNMPIKCSIDVDIDREYNEAHKENNGSHTPTLDIAVILAGNHEGAMVGDVDIIIKSGKIGRVVNGSLGARRNTSNYNAPYNTYMGRANILIDPAHSESNNKNTDVNSRVEITEIYGGSAGRGFAGGQLVENPFYGYSTITIKGGTFKIPSECNSENIFSGIYGAGAGGMNGIGDDTYHTTDERIPYWTNSSTKSVMAFGSYNTAKANLCMYNCYNADTHTYTEVDPRLTHNKIIIEGGIFGSETRKIDGIYAGGSGYMSKDLWKANSIPSKEGGNIYGKAGETVASLTINGGEFYCENGIFAGGRGTDYFYSTDQKGGNAAEYTDLGKIYGNVELTINGGNFHCPVFGGGYGVADAKRLNSSDITTLDKMARIYGKSTVKINGGTFFKNIYGGGDMAVVEQGTNIAISDNADIRGDVFAGGNGRKKRLESNTTIADDTWHPELVGKVLGGTNLNFYGTSAQAPSIYGDIYGGGNRAQVEGDTHINIYAANFAGEIYGGGKGLITDSNGKLLAKDLYTYANVTGNTFVKLAQDQGAQTEGENGKKQDNFSINVIWDKKWNGTNWITWNDNKSKFFNDDGQFVCSHNIYGGGNQACNVTGKATLTILKGMTPFGLLKTAEWKKAYDDSDHPHFAVFGGGYGINTTVGSTDVTVNVNGDYGIYNTEIEDDTEQLAKPHRPFSKSKNRRNAASSNKEEISIFDNSKGIPNFTILSALGGGYAGKVNKSTKVTIDGKTFLHRVYGGGFGDPFSTVNNETGQIGGNTEVYIQGAKIYGDVFGGGAGVAPKDNTYFTDVAKVLGTTKVEISGEAKIYGNVYGGGDIANIKSDTTLTGAEKEAYYNTKPKSESKLDQTTGKFLSYEAKDYTTFVNITGGDIFGEVFGGGKGLKKAEATEYYKVGRINGNTLVHVVNTNATSLADTDSQGNIVPFIWNNIYGGCAFGTVNGSTLVHIEGGKLGHNIYGGGYGNIKIDLTGNKTEEEEEEITRNTVLGKVDKNKEGTYANILGNTKVQIDGGTWIWNRKADINGNITTWLAVQNNEKICENIDEFKEITAAILKAKTANEITNEKAKAAINRIISDENTQQFYAFTKGTMNSGSFKRDHNIYGGGNRACYVGFGQDGNSTIGNGTSDSNGLSEVIINHSPLADVITKDGNQISVFDETSLAGLCWYISSKNTNDPQFSILGAGFGANTKVVKTEVCVQPGNKMNDDGVITVNGIKYRYLNQNADLKTYVDFEKQIYNDFLKVSKDDKKLYFGSVTGSNPGDADFDPMTFKRYHASRWAWTLGLPGFTFQAIHGGGFSGYVTGETYVETDCQPFCENIFGAGVGAMPIGNITATNPGESYDFGKVGTRSRVFIKSGYVAQNVYGGGAGIESIYDKNQNTWIDFPNMARVPKTEVYVYGRNIKYKQNLGLIARTMILGSVYGGGDVANVGNEKAKEAPDVFNFEHHQVPARYTSLVNIRGGVVFSQVFAGGRGRLKSECKDYKKLGGIYGNTSLVIDRPNITYPYFDEEKKEYIKPWSDNAMKHPDNDKNKDIMPAFLERIYGGCENGTVYGNTFMSISDGQIGHGIYGGGWGNCDTLTVNGTDSVNVTSADVTGNTNIMINGGQALLSSYWNPETRSWRPASIIDGIIYSPQYDHEALKFKVNHNIYAGGNEACVVGKDAYLTMEKGLLHDSTQMAYGVNKKFFETMAWKEIYNKVGSPHFCVFGGGYGEHTVIQGDTHVKINMEENNNKGHVDDIKKGEEYRHFLSGFSVMDIVGGGYSGKVVGNTHVEGSGGIFCRRVFGGGFYNSVKSTTVNIKAIDCHDIFGGGMMGDVIDSTAVNIGNPSAQNSNKAIFIHGNVYGGNDVSGYVNVSVKDGDFTDNNGSGTHINIYGGKIYGNVYGAGNGNYLYALDKNQNQKVTVNEYYPMNPEDPNSETVPLVYTVPMREFMPSYKGASDAAKIVNINSWRPLTNKVNIEIKGNSTSEKVNIAGDVYGGGNSATVQKVKSKDSKAVEKVGNIHINIGSHVNIGRVFMGCNGDELFAKSEDNDFMNKFQKLNGNVEDYTQELNLADTIDWFFNPSNKAIGTLYLPTKLEDRPTVYPHLIDLYFQPVETDIQGELLWNGNQTGKGLEDCTIKTFYCGGNRGNMNIYPNPNAKGNVINYIFPEGLTITDKIVGGCNNANYNYKGLVNHEGGYLLGRAYSTEPFIKLTIKNKFQPEEKNNAYVGGNVFGGCYKTGTVRGDVTIDLQSDMLAGKDKKKLENSNDSLATKPEYASLNIYGAGYGMESYVYGNTHIIMGKDMKCSEPKTEGGKFLPCGVNGATGVSANFIYGGGQQGNVIGLTDVDILNGHVFRSVTGGSYSGYVYGSTQVKVGYPTYYQVKKGHSGIYLLDRTDKNNLYIDHENKNKDGKILPNLASETIKQSIRLISGDKVSQAVYASIIGKQGVTDFVKEKENDFDAFPTAPASPLTWNDINIKIGEAIYGGGYSVAQGTSVMANDSTVLKFTRQYNIDKVFTERQEKLSDLPNGTTTGFGGNTTILVADNSATDSDRDHIIISHQKMKSVVLPTGTDLFGYYYMDKDGNYRYISLQDNYFYGAGYKKPEHQSETDTNIYAYDSEGGIFGDGHQSYAAGFRSADLTGYGFAGTNINNPKIINTFQRMDILRLEDNCFNVLGARDYATNQTNKTPYSIARVGEIQMFAKNITLTDNKLQDKSKNRARNYMGLANNIHYVGAVTSNVPFNDAKTEPWRNNTGMVPADGDFKGKSYMDVKQDYIDKHDQNFQKRNDGTAKNMIGIASGYALKIQNVQELYDDSKKNVIDSIFYGPIYGVVEMNLIDVREDEGGGYVYADNVHKRATAEGETGHKVDFLETTGNFVFPYDAKQNRFVVDDCFPTGFYGMDDEGKANPDDKIDVHYWYVTGFNYYYNAHITGYTYKDKMTFFSDNKDGLTVLSGLKPNQPVTIQSWKMRSEHPEDKTKYSCDLEERNYRPAGTEGNVDMDNQDVSGKYKLSIGASSSEEYDGKGFAAVLPMNGKFNKDENYVNQKLPSKLTDGDAKISFQLTDNVNNTTTDYFKKHLSEKCLATVVLKGRAYEEYKDSTHNTPIISKVASSDFFTQEGNDYKQVTTGTKLSAGKEYYIMNSIAGEYTKIYPDRIYIKDSTAEDGYAKVSITDVKAGSSNYYCEVERIYTYTIYLTIEYVQGPNINGKITVDNCALPGEMVRLRKNQISIEADESFSANGYYWRIGKRKQNEKGNWVFEDDTEWDINKKATGYDTYKQGSSEAQGLFKDCVYDKTNDYLDIPAYYFMNGYGVQLGITMNGLNKIFTVDMADDSQFTVHNYHRMNPHQKGVNLHLSEAIQRTKEDKTFAEPRIYISDASDLKAFINFVDTIGTGTGSKAEQYGKNAQFVLQNDITVTSDFDGSNAVFAGTLHGNGHVIKGLAQGKSFLKENRGNIYNLGMESGNIAAEGCTNGGAYHCCFEYNKGIQPIVYHMDGTSDTHYTADDFRYGKVGYDLNEYYLRARYSNNMETEADKAALKYVYDYYANGDYQYAHRTDAITGNNTGITYLRKGTDSDQPNYGSNETRHDQSHAIDAARKASQGTASAVSYVPLFNGNQADGSQPMNDFIFWGQSLQKVPDLCPSQIASHQNSYMRNRIYRTAGYYGDTKLDAFHYNASNNANSLMSTYVHQTTTTAIDFTCLNDKGAAMGFKQAAGINQNGIFYPPVDDNAKVFSDLSIQQGVSQNLLVYTAANDIDNNTEAYDIADNALGYKENTSETTIYGHHIFKNNADNGYTTSLLHLVERTPEGKNSEGDKCENNDFCAPIPFTVTNHAWYVRKPMYYAEDATGAWEGICLPFTAQKVKASLNGEITHFYGDKYLNHEYWLRGLTEVNTTNNTATFQRPGTTTAGLFQAEGAESKDYTFNNNFFVTTYGEHFYNKDANPYYSNQQEYKNYQLLTKGIPYLVRFPGYRYYEFDLSSKFYNNILNTNKSSQTVTFHAFGNENETEPADKAIVIPITQAMATQNNGYSHVGSFAATKVANGTIYGMNAVGTAFDDASTLQTVMPFRTYMTTLMTNDRTRSSEVPSVIRISETTGIDRIEPEINGNDDTPAGESLFIRPIGAHRVRIESTYSTQLQVFSITGQLYRILDVRPGTATYSGFPDGIYIFGNRKIMVK